MTTIELPALTSPVDQLWHVLLDLGERLQVPWTVVGGQMVLMHALENGAVPPQISQDGDIVADIRADQQALVGVVAQLEELGFGLDGISADGLAHRFVRPAEPKHVVVDVLAPEGLGPKADLTTSPPGRTLEVPGATQAVDRTEFVTVLHEGREGRVPRPTLLGALVIKSVATKLANPSRHFRDLALLYSLIADPFALLDELSRKDRKRLAAVAALSDDRHEAWLLVPDGIRAQGQIAYTVLTAKAPQE